VITRFILALALTFSQGASTTVAPKTTLFPKTTTIGAAGTSQQATLARQFNGSSDFLKSSAGIDMPGGVLILSISFWLYQNAFDNADELAMESSDNFNNNRGAFLVDPNSSGFPGNFQYAVRGGLAGIYLTCTFARPSAAAWHHYLLILDASTTGGTCGAFVDGVSQTTTRQQTPGETIAFTSQTLNVMSRNGASLFNAGRMTSIAIWGADETANASTIASCSTSISTVDNTNLLDYWKIQQISPETPIVGTPNLNVTGTTNVAGPC